MKKTKLIIFLVNGKPVEEIDGDDITLDGTMQMKTNIAIMHGVSFDEVEVDTKDIEVQYLSQTAVVNRIGALLFRANSNTMHWKTVTGIRPAFDLSHSELFNEWLYLISKNDIEKAIIFN